MKQRFDWRFNVDSFSFVGGVNSFLKALYEKCLSDFDDISFVLLIVFILNLMQLTVFFFSV